MRHYFIDGYNLIFRVFQKKASLEEKRSEILAIFNQVALQQQLDLTFVFDATLQKDAMSHRGHYDHLEIVYTGAAESADDYILHEISERINPSLETVITSDRELATRSKNLGAQALSIENFLAMLRKKRRKATKSLSSKDVQESKAELERLLKIFEQRLEDFDRDLMD
jgi:uncharacterized protein